jgi:hypothetical protein
MINLCSANTFKSVVFHYYIFQYVCPIFRDLTPNLKLAYIQIIFVLILKYSIQYVDSKFRVVTI